MERNNRISFANYLCLQRYAEKTKKAYLFTIADLSSFHRQSADELTNEQVQDYLLYCIQDKKLAWSSCNIRFCALKKYYQDYLGYDESRFSIPPRPRSRKLPMLLGQEEVSSILQAPISLKHRALLTTVYGSGLRVSEVVRLRPEHIESKRMQIRVEQGKGRKDRYTVLSQKCLELLRVYWRHYKPGQWLFFGKDKTKPMPVGTAQKAYQRAKEKAGVNKGMGIHTLRHCFASHALEQGVELFIIKRWLGHSSIRTTCTYLHISPKQLREVISPLDLATQGGKQ
jgi:site-specific recombinase XerD